jgi:hypothetical protein
MFSAYRQRRNIDKIWNPDQLFEIEIRRGGMIGVLVDSTEPINPWAGSRQLVTITFDAAPTAQSGPIAIAFSDTLAHRSLSDAEGDLLWTKFADGIVNISGSPLIPR